MSVYKFREWSNQKHRHILADPSLYFADPIDFQDEFDCLLPPTEFTQSSEEIGKLLNEHLERFKDDLPFKYYEQFGKISKEEFDLKKIQAFSKLKLLGNKTLESYEEFYQKQKRINSKIGILSLGNSLDNDFLWSHYAASEGFAVEYNIDLLRESLRDRKQWFSDGKVAYTDKLPPQDWFSFDKEISIQRIMTNIIVKSNRYEQEDEYRVISAQYWNPERKIPINPYSITAVYINSTASKLAKKYITLAARRLGKHIKVKSYKT